MKKTQFWRYFTFGIVLALSLLLIVSCTKIGSLSDAETATDTAAQDSEPMNPSLQETEPEAEADETAEDSLSEATQEETLAEEGATDAPSLDQDTTQEETVTSSEETQADEESLPDTQPLDETLPETSADTEAENAEETAAEVFTEAVTQAPAVETQAATEAVTQAATEAVTQAPRPIVVEVATKDNVNFDRNIAISQSGGSATVTANQGLSYTATGYNGVNGNRFTVNKGFSITLDPAKTAAAFNRFTICYVASQPMKGTITYTENGAARTDSFFLEAGEGSFSCVTSNYLSGKKGQGIARMTFESCNNQNATFALCLLKTQDYPVYSSSADNTYYIENDHYKLGVRLLWGGGINYLEDKQIRRSLRMANLINQADTGRLVQQSYYGTSKEGSYQAGIYNDTQWKYNPVQGGDQYNNHSRIIDIVVKDYSVYVKSQPLDWSLNNQLTPSYMENAYTLYAEYVKVDNRFIDFSGMTSHPFAHQELPAFYTLSALSRFYWYDGSSGWTGDTLSYRDDLNFWGDPQYHDDCCIPVRRSNTETWCAWVHPKVDYGIGIYVPNVDMYLAGKYEHNGSTSASNGATNYVAPLNNMKMVSYQALEYSYLITTGEIEEIRETFKANKSFASNASLRNNYQSMRVQDIADGSGNAGSAGSGSGTGTTTPGGSGTATSTATSLTFNSAASIGALNPIHNSSVAYDSARTAAKLTVTGDDTQVVLDYGGTPSTASFTTLTIKYMIPTSNSKPNYNCDLFICAGAYGDAAEGCRVRQSLVKDGQWHTLTVNLNGQSFWTGKLNKLRFDFFDAAGVGDVMYVQSIEFK